MCKGISGMAQLTEGGVSMERLTIKNWRNLDPWETCGQDNYCKRGCHEQGGCTKGCIVPRIYARLAAYEGTGLEPEEIEDAVTAAKLMARSKIVSCFGVDADHIRELVQAEQAGRLAALPCKVGDKAWFIRKFAKNRCIKQREVDCVNIDSRGNVFVSARRISGGYAGETVFLNREDAEAAPKGGEADA